MSALPATYLPVPFSRMPPRALENLPIYLRNEDAYTLYASPQTPFTAGHRRRLEELHIRFVYVPETHIGQFHQQIEADLESIPFDDSLTPASKSEIIYDTCVELVNELLINPNLEEAQPRLQRVARTIVTQVLLDRYAFSNLFIATYHDAYTATHMVNVGAWMVPLALTLGVTDQNELATICLAGILHDIGKVFVPADLLITQSPLTDEDITDLRRHPQLGADFIRRHTNLDDRIARVALEHHERLDGSGYPRGLTGDDIDPITRLCAVVDSFDAMTAFRPYKSANNTAAETLAILRRETPLRFDRAAIDAWTEIVTETHPDLADDSPVSSVPQADGKRRFRRHRVRCPATVQLLRRRGDAWLPAASQAATAHNISQDGLALLAYDTIEAGDYVRVTLHGGPPLDRTLDAIAVRTRRYPDGLHDVGLKLVDLTTESRALSAEDILYVRNQ